MKHYVDQSGNYLGGWDQNPPDGAIEVPVPQDGRQKWDGEQWLRIPVDPALIAARRYIAETAGIEVYGIRIDTGRDSQALITGAALNAVIDPTYICNWKTPSGFVQLDAQTLIGVATTLRSHVQACFDREAELLEALDAGEFSEGMLEEGWPNESVPAAAAS